MDFLSTSRQGKVLVVELKRTAEGNALNRQLQQELVSAWMELDDSDDLMAAVLTGSPDVFSIGHDREELLTGNGEAASTQAEEGLFPLSFKKPVIAAIEGPCYGLGFELALGCDLRFAGEGAMLGMPDPNLYVRYRLASVLLPRMMYSGPAMQMIYAGRTLSAEEARRYRLVNQVTPKGQALAAATAAATALAGLVTSADAFKKQLVWRLSGIPIPEAQAELRS